jgi:hypothetical protein
MDEAGYRVFDEESATNVGAKVLVDLTTRTHFRLTFRRSPAQAVQVAHRKDNQTKWTLTTYAHTFGTSATGASGVAVAFGQLVDPVGASEHHWWRSDARGVHAFALEGASNPGVGMGPYTYPVPDAHNATRERLCRLRVQGGPAFPGELFSIPAAHTYPIESAFPSYEPNMERLWRSSVGGANQAVLCKLHTAMDIRPVSHHGVILAVDNCNVRQVELVAQDAAGGAVTVIATMDLATGFVGVSWIRLGGQIVPSGTNANGRFIGAGEVVGGQLIIGAASYPIIGNSAGYWSDAASVRAAPTLGGDVSALAGSGTGTIVWPRGVLVAYRAVLATRFQRWGFRIQSTEIVPQGQTGYQGKFSLFGARALGKRWGNGWEWARAGNVASVVDRRGTDRRERLGPARRVLSMAWDHGTKWSRLRDSATDATHYLAPSGTNAPELVARDDVVHQLVGLYREAQDGALPVCAVLKDPPPYTGVGAAGIATETITDPWLYLVGYLDADLRATFGRGDENDDEYVLAGPIRIAELV